jgi:hypothetical protein
MPLTQYFNYIVYCDYDFTDWGVTNNLLTYLIGLDYKIDMSID